MNPIEFRNDDVINDVISGKIALLACKHNNSTISHLVFTKLDMVDGIQVHTGSIE